MITRLALLAILFSSFARAQDLSLGDPANVPPPPAHAIGFPSRAPDLDALPGFKTPPPGYGEVAFYWWIGDPLTRQRLTWQLDQLAGKGVMGLQINYAHTDRGGLSYGLSIPSDPPLFSKQWWELVGWFMNQAKQRGMAISLSDYTLGIGQGFVIDQILNDHPDMSGSLLRSESRDAAGPGPVEMSFKSPVVSLMAYRVQSGKLAAQGALDLRAQVKDSTLRWAPPDGNWRIVAVLAASVTPSLDPMHPRSGPEYAQKFFGAFEDHAPGESGKGLNFFFSDELEFRIHGNLWNARFAEEFKKRKGYDLLPDLPALFTDIGPRTPKVRLDYSDVKVSLTEEGFFKPVFDHHQKHGMIFGCDHGGRGRNVVEFGDYFRTQRWNQGPGCDQPGLGRDITKNKVASSIAHLYQRPRTWLEGFYGSGWGTSSEALTDAVFANMAMGHNLITFHGLYYSTHGGWWEWAPPCNHFRMPYWKQIDPLMTAIQRLSYLLSQGHHRCDVALLYPVAPMEAGMDGPDSVKTAFATGSSLYNAGVDFDYMDFESLARAKVRDRQLNVSGESYRALILPAMKAVRHSTLERALEFYRAGGIVVSMGALPAASDRAGREDPQVDAIVREIFGVTATEAAARPQESSRHANNSGGIGLIATKHEQVIEELARRQPLDFAMEGKGKAPCIMHRKVGPRDVYAIYGAEKGAVATFRATGAVELWDPWTGQARPLAAIRQTNQVTVLRLPLSEKEMQVVVFSPGQARIERDPPAAVEPRSIALDGNWEFELVPTLDNRFGDYRWPPTPTLIGPEARQFRYARETAAAGAGLHEPATDDSRWPTVTCGFGPGFWKLGPLPATANLEKDLLALAAVDPAQAVVVSGRKVAWQPCEFSWRYGLENDPGHQGYHGLKEEMSDDFIALGKLKRTGTGSAYEAEAEGPRYYLWTSVVAPAEVRATLRTGGNRPAAAWVNGQPVKPGSAVPLRAGPNLVLLRYDKPGRGHAVFDLAASPDAAAASEEPSVFSGDARYIWFPNDRGRLALFRKTFDLDKLPEAASIRITCDNGYVLHVNGAVVGRGGAWQRIQQYDVRKHLRAGRNLLAVEARNEGDSAGLIAELALGADRRIATDATWRCVRQNVEGWLDAGFDDKAWSAAEVISGFTDSLWYKHPNGPPLLDAAAAAPGIAPANVGSLAMRWHANKDILPFDPFPGSSTQAGWYRFTSPPGLRAMTIAARGTVQAWADGQACAVVAGAKSASGAVSQVVTLPKPAAAPVKIALRIGHDRGFAGGAAIAEPIALDCGAGLIALGDWSAIDGLRAYSGGARYGRTFDLDADPASSRITLDLGKVVSSAEVLINGKSAGVRVAPPWVFDLSSGVRRGSNRVEVLVYNTLANHYLTIPTRYRGKLDSGLIGPVTVQVLGRGQ